MVKPETKTLSKSGLSVIVPFFNEEKNLAYLHKEIVGVLGKLNIASEIIYVDDGSTDSSLEVIKSAIDVDKSIPTQIVVFKRNFGQTAAISAGIAAAKGGLISTLDADLQNDPADLPRFLEKLDQGYDAAFGWRKERKDRTARSLLSKLANILIGKLFNYPFHDVGCSARVVKREFLPGAELYGELHRILPVLIYFKGAKIAEVVVNHRPRTRGKSKYGFERIIKTLIDIITVKFLQSYGTKPAYVFGSLGFAAIVGGCISLFFRDIVFSLAVLILFVGLGFIMMGLLAELQVRTYFESQGKPIYDIKETIKY